MNAPVPEVPDPIKATREKIQRYLSELRGQIVVDKDGDIAFLLGTAPVYMRVRPIFNASTVVRVFAEPNLDIPASPELFRYVACEAGLFFGNLIAIEKDGLVRIIVTHDLLGDALGAAELRVAVTAVAVHADRIHAHIRETFGGRTFKEPRPATA
jgi:hypothetical protein